MEATDLEVGWLERGVEQLLGSLPGGLISDEDFQKTPARVGRAFREYFAGCFQDPRTVLTAGFASDCDEMIYVNNIGFTSFCAHHLVPFMGRVHFAYLPAGKIVGLSKIPRLVEVYAKRPQIQEQLTAQIVSMFEEVIQPRGCGAVVEAYHLCMAVRGVKKEEAYTKTTALRGCFKADLGVKQEFLDGVNHNRGGSLWP